MAKPRVDQRTVLLVIAGCLALAACNRTVARPPQTDMFVLRASSPEALDQFVRQSARRLGLQVSQKTFDGPGGARRDYEAYGGGLSIFVLQAMVEGCPGPDGNYPAAQVDPQRYDILAAKTGLWSHQTPQQLFTAFVREAREANLEFEPKAGFQRRVAEGCSKGS